METKDLLIAPIFIGLIFLIANIIKSRHKDKPDLIQYYTSGLNVRFVGAIAAGLIYFFYYGGGDTITFFNRGLNITAYYNANPGVFYKLFFYEIYQNDYQVIDYFKGLRAWDTSTYMVSRIVAFWCLVTGGSYTAIAVIFAGFSFSGVWLLYRTFTDMYPKLYKEMAYAVFFIPSVFFWGSGVFKDTVTFTCLCWLTWASYNIFIKRSNFMPSIILGGIAGWLIVVIKTYIIMSFAPALVMWIFLTYRSKIGNKAIQRASTPIVVGVSLALGLVMIRQMGESSKFSLENMSQSAYEMQWWHTQIYEMYGDEGGGSFYSLGDPDPSLGGMLRKVPAAINVTLFRPYLWEVRNPVMLLAAIESLLFLYFTLRIFYQAGVRRVFGYIVDHPVIFFCLVFSLVFAFGVGFTSYNFGALVRYKIPCMPFYVIFLILVYYYAAEEKRATETVVVDELSTGEDSNSGFLQRKKRRNRKTGFVTG